MAAPEAHPVLLSWSGGKDSAMALQALVDDPRHEVVGLLTTVAEGDRRAGVSHECDHPEEARRKPRVTEAAIDALGTPGREIDETVRARLAEGRSLYAVDEDLLRELRPRLVDTLEILAAVLHPERFAKGAPEHAVVRMV